MEEQTTTQPTENSSNKMMMIVGGVLLLALVGGGVFFLSSSKGSASTPSPIAKVESMATVTPSSQATPSASSSSSASQLAQQTDPKAKVFTIDAGSFYYKPNEIKVKKGDTVKIVMNSKDMMHDFIIDELKVKIPVTKSGSTAEVTFVADTAGTFEFYCSVGAHRQQGQVGKIIIE